MKRNLLALLLAPAMALSMGTTALAVDNVPIGGTAPNPPDSYIPDPAGIVTFENMDRRMREGNLNVLALQENIQVIRSIDYDEMTEDIRKGLNEIANTQWNLISAGSMISTGIPDIDAVISGMMSMSTAPAVQQLQVQYDSLRDTFDDLKSGKLQADNEDLIWQLENAQNQIVMAGESMYIALASMEQGGRTVDRGLETLDRTLEELELRYQLGHISAQTLEQTRGGRTALLSNQETLNSNITTYKMQLEMLIGAQLTGSIQLGGLPQVTEEQLQSMDLDRDLADAKRASYSLYAAKQTLDEAEEDYKDAGSKYNYNDKHYEFVQASHTWQAAQHNYNVTVQNFEMGLRTLYLKVKDNKQALEAAKAALALEQSSYAIAQLKYTQGNLSENGLLDAEDKVKEAQEAIDQAEVELFSNYHTYRWAVDYGILNT